jgi:hypothetical protein
MKAPPSPRMLCCRESQVNASWRLHFRDGESSLKVDPSFVQRFFSTIASVDAAEAFPYTVISLPDEAGRPSLPSHSTESEEANGRFRSRTSPAQFFESRQND